MNLQCLFLLAVIVATIGSTNVYGADDNQTQHDGVGVDEPKKPKIICDADNCICDKDEKKVDGKCEPKDLSRRKVVMIPIQGLVYHHRHQT
jgi:hypothetical protein